jgi:hypothetical protein
MRPISIWFLIFGMVACSRMAYADSIRTLDIGSGVSITPSDSVDPGTKTITFVCCNGVRGTINDLEVVFTTPFADATVTAPGGCSDKMTDTTITITCDTEIETREKIVLSVSPGDETVDRKNTWWTDGGDKVGNASPVPEPSNLILLGSGLLGLVPVIRRKLRR